MGRNGMAVAFEAGDFSGAEATAKANPLRGLVDDVIESDFVIGLAMARRAQAIERAYRLSTELAANPASGNSSPHSRDMAQRAFVAEIATSLRMPERTAETLIHTSSALVTVLPATLLALSEGRLGYRHAQILVDQTAGLEQADARAFESRMLPVAERNTPSRFERSVRRARERLHPETMVERQVVAVEDRSVQLFPSQDGLGVLEIHGPIVQLVAIENRITDIARNGQFAGEPRSLAQLKFDVLTDILLDIDGQDGTIASRDIGPIARSRSIRPRVLVTVPALTLVGKSDQPGELEGYGPIDAETAREVASLAKSWQRLLIDPVTGIVLRMGRKKYRPPSDLRAWLRVRDGTCRFPGCNRAAIRCDLDHTEDWHTEDWDAKNGPTDHDNLAHVCPHHHKLKHNSGWTVEQLPGGLLRWCSPAGIWYETDPDLVMAPSA